MKRLPSYFDDTLAERIGTELAQDFGLKRSREHADRWVTENGTFTNKGIARRAHRIMTEAFAATRPIKRSRKDKK